MERVIKDKYVTRGRLQATRSELSNATLRWRTKSKQRGNYPAITETTTPRTIDAPQETKT